MNPELIIADEPVSALDVSIQVINLMEELQEEFNLTYLFISHDLSVVRHISDRVGVMYLGKMMELTENTSCTAIRFTLIRRRFCLQCPSREKDAVKRERIILKGELPSPANPPKGCVFHTRCPIKPICKEQIPAFEEAAPITSPAIYMPEMTSIERGMPDYITSLLHIYHKGELI